MLTADRLRRTLKYDAETGLFTRLVGVRGHAIGSVAGRLNNDGYIGIGIDGRLYYAHRLAVLWMTGIWPTDEVDHIDRDRANNRWANLREATSAQNSRNRSKHSTNTSGVTGVSWHRRDHKWVAAIKCGGASRHLGYFDTPEDAAAARKAAEIVFFAEFTPQNGADAHADDVRIG